MIFSIHIPKTAGSSFRMALEQRFGEKLALYYGVGDDKTTPAIRVRPEELASRLPELERAGIEVLHGHFQPRLVAEAARAPGAKLWTWLRDPVERTVSQFSFYGERETKNKLGERVRSGEIDFEQFANIPGLRNFQSAYLEGFGLEEFDFVGVSERFELGLALLFGYDAPRLARRYNVTDRKIEIDPTTRERLLAVNAQDYALYAEGLTLMLDRLAGRTPIDVPAKPKAGGSGLLKRLIRKVS